MNTTVCYRSYPPKGQMQSVNLSNIAILDLCYFSCSKATQIMRFALYARLTHMHLNVHGINTANQEVRQHSWNITIKTLQNLQFQPDLYVQKLGTSYG